MALSKEPIIKEIDIQEAATSKLAKRGQYEHHRVGNISYLTTGPTFSQFTYSCEPGPGSYDPGGPSCLAFGYDEKAENVELHIPTYLIVELARIDEVFYDGSFFLENSHLLQ